jgi:hypothetical protein
MPTLTKELLSGSVGGQPILITATASTGTIIHTTSTSSTVIDEVWLYATNTSAVGYSIFVEYGGTSQPTNILPFYIEPSSGLYILLPGLILSGTGVAGRVIRAYASTGSVINVVGYVNRYTP